MSSALSAAFRAILVVGKTVLRHYDEANITCNSSLLVWERCIESKSSNVAI